MSYDQTVVFVILGLTLVGFMWGRWRYDLVALAALFAGVVTGIVPAADAFAGFGHPATITVAAVLVLSRALSNSGAVDALARTLAPAMKTTTSQIGTLSGLGAVLSTVMNNIGALSMLMPLAIHTAQQARRSPSIVLMPLSFATLLGGLVTLIGTPPNIIVSGYRASIAGEPFGMFSFTPVGGPVAIIGVIFIALIGWRLIPRRAAAAQDMFKIEDFVAEGVVKADSAALDKTVEEIDAISDKHDVVLIGLLRKDLRIFVSARHQRVREGDLIVVEGGAEEVSKLAKALGLDLATTDEDVRAMLQSPDYVLREAVVAPRSELVGRTPPSLRLTGRYGINLLAMSRHGQPIRERLGRLRFRVGDILLFHGDSERLSQVIPALGCLPLGERRLQSATPGKIALAVGIFAVAVIVTSVGLAPPQIALSVGALLVVLCGIVPTREMYESIDWSIIVLLGAMVPLGLALESTGGTGLIAALIMALTSGLPDVAVLAALMVATMWLTGVINNAATALVVAPIAMTLGQQMGANPDAFLMAVAIGASADFLTPIGHQNNALILGPGGYRFGDYWRMGLPLEAVVVAVSVPLIAVFFPL